MSRHFIQSAIIRNLGKSVLRTNARARFWRTGPRIFINSVPKAGTHLLLAELAKVGALSHSYLHLDNRKFDRSTAMSDGTGSIDIEVIARMISSVRDGQYFSGHVGWDRRLEELLIDKGIKTIFVTRDPRAVLVSRYNYIVGLKRHWLHDFVTTYSGDPVDRYRVLVEGHRSAPFIRPMDDRLAAYLPWLESPAAITVRFEALVGARGGGSDALKSDVLANLLDYVGVEGSALTQEKIAERTVSATFRKGRTDSWRDELPPEILNLVEARCGEVLQAMGYPLAANRQTD